MALGEHHGVSAEEIQESNVDAGQTLALKRGVAFHHGSFEISAIFGTPVDFDPVFDGQQDPIFLACTVFRKAMVFRDRERGDAGADLGNLKHLRCGAHGGDRRQNVGGVEVKGAAERSVKVAVDFSPRIWRE